MITPQSRPRSCAKQYLFMWLDKIDRCLQSPQLGTLLGTVPMPVLKEFNSDNGYESWFVHMMIAQQYPKARNSIHSCTKQTSTRTIMTFPWYFDGVAIGLTLSARERVMVPTQNLTYSCFLQCQTTHTYKPDTIQSESYSTIY